jgi:DNA-binding NarL/FixJ family response regulator
LPATRKAVRLFSPMTPVRVMAVDHREPSRQAARELVASTSGFTWLAGAGTAEEALEAAVQMRPDLVLVEAEMPGIDGLETRKRLEEAVPGTVVVLLSAEEDLTLEGLTAERLRALWNQTRPA